MAVDWDSLVIGPTVEIFGEHVRYMPVAGGKPFNITGVFDEAYIQLTPLGRGGIDQENFALGSPGSITTEMPVLGVQLSQFRTPPDQDDVLVVRDQRYAVKEVRLDGHGGAKLLLNMV
jgi:hypothetical protein